MNEFFKDVPKIQYEGPESDNPLAFKHYNPEEKVGDKTMREHLRFSVAYWHSFCGTGADPFGVGTMIRPWDDIADPMEKAKARARGAFEFFQKLGVGFFCFHDRDIAPEADSLKETNRRLDEITELFKELKKETGVELLWGTACLFANPRFVHGAASSCNANVFAYAAAQVKKAMEITHELNGHGYTFWGGREGYETLLNTDMGLELDNLGRFFHMAVDYKKQLGMKAQFYIEPKPKEPTKHQYDFDVATVLGFLEHYGLDKDFKINVEANHATLAGHTFEHELHLARTRGMLGSVDANEGDLLLGWDTDHLPTDVYAATLGMYEILKAGGFTTGGLNFDAKLRRPSFEPIDLFHGHIAGMDTFARALKNAHRLIQDGPLDKFIDERYSSYKSGIGADIVNNKVGFKELEQHAMQNEPIQNASGREEYLRNILNRYVTG
ncbi:MAG: xylose isomerase [Candidatus Hydrogenedentota bacterium]